LNSHLDAFIGTWLRDLPRQLSHRELSLHGVDIGEALFPTSKGRTVDLKQHNITQPFPEIFSWHNSFDIVHQRLLIWGIKSNEWLPVIRNYLEILKPGGYLQLVEAEWINPLQPMELPQLKKQAILQKWSTEQFEMEIDIAYQLEEHLHNAGFDRIQKVQFDHGYGAKAKDPVFANPSAELWVDCFRSLDTKIGRELDPRKR
jgi:SAM-dependent methyltransferase